MSLPLITIDTFTHFIISLISVLQSPHVPLEHMFMSFPANRSRHYQNMFAKLHSMIPETLSMTQSS